MTKQYETNPNPSQPKININALGIKINNNIDKINKITIQQKEILFLSLPIYLWLYQITILEIIKTAKENIHLIQSKRM